MVFNSTGSSSFLLCCSYTCLHRHPLVSMPCVMLDLRHENRWKSWQSAVAPAILGALRQGGFTTTSSMVSPLQRGEACSRQSEDVQHLGDVAVSGRCGGIGEASVRVDGSATATSPATTRCADGCVHAVDERKKAISIFTLGRHRAPWRRDHSNE